jgi:hypothetical protein
MSVEQVKAFFAKVKEDSTLAQKIKDAEAAYKGNASDKVAEFAEIVIPVAAQAGFNFTVDDFKAAYYNSEGEASDDELDAIAGGYIKGCGWISKIWNDW